MRLLVLLTALLTAVPLAAEPVDFTLDNIDGEPVSLSDFRGKRTDGDYADYGPEVQIAQYRI